MTNPLTFSALFGKQRETKHQSYHLHLGNAASRSTTLMFEKRALR